LKAVEIKPNIFWVGAVDWDLRYFHGYITPRGTTYNSYLIMDEKITLVDTVKSPFFEEMLGRIKEAVDPSMINYLIVNHIEMDHFGNLPKIMEMFPQIKIIISPNGLKGAQRHYYREWDCRVVNSGDELNTGKYTLKFAHVPMVHWPDSMVTYIPQEELLFSNDAFGQHIASATRFDAGLGWDIVSEEAAKYYANIVFPYGDQVNKALDLVEDLPVEMIAPSHGMIWKFFKRIGFAFGSFGWGGQGAVKVREELQSMGWEMPGDVLNIKYRPTGDEIEEVKMTGFKLGQVIKNGD